MKILKINKMMVQIDDITKDLGFKEEAESYVKYRLKRHEYIYLDILNAAKDAYMRGLQSGYQCGYKIGYNRAEKELKRRH